MNQKVLTMIYLKIISTLKARLHYTKLELYKTNDKEKNSLLVNLIKSGLKDLEKEIKDMSEEERKNEKPDKIVEIVKEILNLITKYNKDKA